MYTHIAADNTCHSNLAVKILLALAVAFAGGCTGEKKVAANSTAAAHAGQSDAAAAKQPVAPQSPTSSGATQHYREVKWEHLIPKEDLDALLNPPDYLDTIAEGSASDTLNTRSTDNKMTEQESRYQQALRSTKIKPEFDRQQIRIPGFVVPLEFDDEQTITRFLLVPYFGACLHLPPPPPNQVIYAEFPTGFQVAALYDPFYIEGELRTLPEDTEQGTAAYTVRVAWVYPYEE